MRKRLGVCLEYQLGRLDNYFMIWTKIPNCPNYVGENIYNNIDFTLDRTTREPIDKLLKILIKGSENS